MTNSVLEKIIHFSYTIISHIPFAKKIVSFFGIKHVIGFGRKKGIFNKINQFDEKFDLYYGDSDLCLKVSKLGYSVIYTPFAFLRHDDSSKIKEHATSFFTIENYLDFKKKWISSGYTDPYYNPNLGWDYKIN